MRVRRIAWSGMLALALASCGGDGGGAGTSPPAATPISISSTTAASVAENSTATVYQVTTAGGSGAVTYALSGPDAAAFAISATGAVTFRAAPDFERPTDSDQNNSYLLTVRATDSTGEATRDITITVTNVADATVFQGVGGSYFLASHIAPAPDQEGIFISQRDGLVYLLVPTTPGQGTLYLQVAGAVNPIATSTGTRRGLMAVAAASDFATTGFLYAYVATADALEVRRYGRAANGIAAPATVDVILRIPFPADTRDVGGWLGFGPDNLLYLTTGSAGAGQANASLLGKVLRIDPSRDAFPDDPLRDYAIPTSNPFADGTGGAAEVYAAGFADPWRAGFDGSNLYVGDQNNDQARQGVSSLYLVRPADAGRTFSRFGGGQSIAPVLQTGSQLSSPGVIVGGLVYRGPSPEFAGRYFFQATGGITPNSYDGIFTVPAANLVQGTTLTTPGCCTLVNPPARAIAFGEDRSRNLYYTSGSTIIAIRYQ